MSIAKPHTFNFAARSLRMCAFLLPPFDVPVVFLGVSKRASQLLFGRIVCELKAISALLPRIQIDVETANHLGSFAVSLRGTGRWVSSAWLFMSLPRGSGW